MGGVAAHLRRRWGLGLALVPAATAVGACSLGFDTFDPRATDGTDAGQADTWRGGSDAALDGQGGDSSGDDSSPDSGSGGDTGSGEAGCAGLQGCLSAATSCDQPCKSAYQQCLQMCGGQGQQCRQACKSKENQCRGACITTCVSCTTSAGCADMADCQTASTM